MPNYISQANVRQLSQQEQKDLFDDIKQKTTQFTNS